MHEEQQRVTKKLTRREHQVLVGVAGGLVTAQIAQQLRIRERTVDSHIANLMRKLSCNTRSQAVARAFRAGILK